MTAQLEAPTVPLTPMSADEARACVDRIKRSVEDIRAELWQLKERQGWRALGYTSWQDCIRDEFAMSRQRAYQLVNAYTVDRILAGDDVSTNVDTGNGGDVARVAEIDPIPEAHARELAAILDAPDTVRAVVAEVKETKGFSATADDVRQVVDRHLARPARAPKPERRSVSSATDASDCQDMPDDLLLGPTADPDDLGVREDAGDAFADVANNEAPRAGPRERFCDGCGDHYRGEACPCKTTPAPMEGGAEPAEPEYPTTAEMPCTECGGEIVLLSEQDDLARGRSINAAMAEGRPIVQLCERCQIGDGEPPSDQPAAHGTRDAVASPSIAASATEVGDSLPPQAPPAVPDQPGVAGLSAEADTPADTTPAPPAGPSPVACPEQIAQIRSAEQQYWMGVAAFLPLLQIDPAELVPVIPLDRHQEMRDTHAAIIAWLGNMGVALFQAKQRAAQQGAT